MSYTPRKIAQGFASWGLGYTEEEVLLWFLNEFPTPGPFRFDMEFTPQFYNQMIDKFRLKGPRGIITKKQTEFFRAPERSVKGKRKRSRSRSRSRYRSRSRSRSKRKRSKK